MKKVLVMGGIQVKKEPLDRGIFGVYHKDTNTTAFSVRRDGSFHCL